MKIVADENIPCVQQAFAPLGHIVTLPGRGMNQRDLIDCDCLLVRSVTPVGASLLQDTPVKFVASATIGTDHIDLDYLHNQGIGFANAPGCNAESASEYIINALFQLAQRKGFDPFKLKAGIIGHGNVGSRVRQKLDILGIETLVNDPPLEDAGDQQVDYVPLDSILSDCDFITLHVPLTYSGPYPTFHLFNRARLAQLQTGGILFNAARGPVIDNQALLELMEQRSDLTIFLDTWEGEPNINIELLSKVDLATPHIAGYSVEGKLRGTQMISDAASRFFGTDNNWSMMDHMPPKQTLTLKSNTPDKVWFELFERHYNVFDDHQRLLDTAKLAKTVRGAAFDKLRKGYPKRFEYDHHRVAADTTKKTASQIERLLFQLSSIE